jgi:hypothetical protein
MPVFGLLQLLQTSKHGPPRCVRAFAVKLVPIPNGRCVQFIGHNVQFVGHTMASGRDRPRWALRLVAGGGVPDDSQERDSRQWFCTAVNRGSTPGFCPRRG